MAEADDAQEKDTYTGTRTVVALVLSFALALSLLVPSSSLLPLPFPRSPRLAPISFPFSPRVPTVPPGPVVLGVLLTGMLVVGLVTG